MDRPAEHRAAPDGGQPDAEAAAADRGRGAAADAESRRSCPHTRRWSPSTSATARRSGRLGPDGPQTVASHPRVTDTVKLSILDWDDVIDRTALGFDQVKPPGLAEVTALDGRGTPIAAADAARNRDPGHHAAVRQGPDHRRRRTVRPDLGRPPPSARCSTANPIAATAVPDATRSRCPPGEQELLISPGPAFVADGVQLAGPLAADSAQRANDSRARPTQWQRRPPRGRRRRRRTRQRVLVVPESINPGWTAHAGGRHRADGRSRSTAGSRAGSLPAGHVGAGHAGLRLEHALPDRALRRSGAAARCCCCSRCCPSGATAQPDEPASPWQPGPLGAGAAVLAVGFVVSGFVGRRGRRRRDRVAVPAARATAALSDRSTLGVAAGGLILAGAVLSRYPWRSVDGYVGHAWGVQLLALISVALLAASVVPDFDRSLGADDRP